MNKKNINNLNLALSELSGLTYYLTVSEDDYLGRLAYIKTRTDKVYKSLTEIEKNIKHNAVYTAKKEMKK